MYLNLNNFKVNSNLQSEMNYGTKEFPFEIFEVYYDDLCNYNIGFIRWHWHKEVQISIVLKGSSEFDFLDKSLQISEGNGVFINSNNLHQIKPVTSDNIVIDIIFDPMLIGGNGLSIIDKKYIYPIVNNTNLNFAFLDKSIKWNRKVIEKLISIYDYYKEQNFGYELLIKSNLCSLWLDIGENLIPNLKFDSAINNYEGERMKRIIGYIHDNYSKDISLSDIASSVHISKSECCKCFKKHLKMSPFEYLMQYRIIEASNILRYSNKTVSEIMNLVGFNNSSYFTKIFKRFTNYTPREYRKKFK